MPDCLFPGSVLELIDLVEAAWTDEEKRTLGKLLDELVDFMKRTPAGDKERAELIMRARQLRGQMDI